MRILFRRSVSFFVWTAVAVCLWFLWPAKLGGNFSMVIVAGDSMEPVMSIGDVALAWNTTPEVGDVLVYRVPKGNAGEGIQIVHRVVEVRPTDLGPAYVTLGDNRSSKDHWLPTEEDVVGVVRFVIPNLGGIILGLAFPIFSGGLLGLVALLWLWPDPSETQLSLSASEDEDPHRAGQTRPDQLSASQPSAGQLSSDLPSSDHFSGYLDLDPEPSPPRAWLVQLLHLNKIAARDNSAPGSAASSGAAPSSTAPSSTDSDHATADMDPGLSGFSSSHAEEAPL